MLSSLILGSCDSLNGKDGANGNNANIQINEDGYININGEQTEYYFVNKDCKVIVNIENPTYGKVIGGGDFSYGSGTLLNAVPFENGVFVAWKDKDSNIISEDKDLVVVVNHGENIYTAIFACSPDYVTANINVKFDESTLPNADYIGKNNVKLTEGIDLKFDGYNDKSLILYTLDKQNFDLNYEQINEKINNGEIKNPKTISYDEYISLYDKNKTYYEPEIDFYYYVIGKASSKYTVNISSIGTYGVITYLDGSSIIPSQEYQSGSVIKLKTASTKKIVNGNEFEVCNFSHWEINGKKASTENELVYSIWENTNIVAHFISKTKLNLIIRSDEYGLTEGRYKECKDPSKAIGSINGNNFDVDLDLSLGYKTIELGYFDAGEIIALQLKIYAEPNSKVPLFLFENSWKYINLSYSYNGTTIGSGNSLLFFVPPGVNDESFLTVKYIRTTNYISEAKDESGNLVKETLNGSGFGLLD